MSCTPLGPRSTRWRRNADQPDLSSLAPSQMPRNLPKTLRIDGAGHQQRDIADFVSPGPLHHDAIEMFAFDALVPPRLDLGVDLLVEVRTPCSGLSTGRGIWSLLDRNFPHLAGRRSAVLVISAFVFCRSTAALDRGPWSWLNESI